MGLSRQYAPYMELTRIFDLLPYCKAKYNSPCLVASKVGERWIPLSIDEVIDQADSVSRGLIARGIKKDDKVGIMSANRPEWNILDFAITQLGAVQVPFYPTLSDTDFEFIVRDCELKILFVSTRDLYTRVHELCAHLAFSVQLFTFDTIAGADSWELVREEGKKAPLTPLEPYRAQVAPEDLFTLIYTSGTTGQPKGVMLSHRNVVSQLFATQTLVPEGSKIALSFLPLSHIFERKVVYLYMFSNVSIFYAENMDTIVANLKEVHPNIFTTVPRLLEKVYDRIVAKGKELKGIKRAIFFWALDLGLQYNPQGEHSFVDKIQLLIARKLVFSKWIEALGGEVKSIISGGAALQPRLARVFTAAGATVLEGYGLTETSPVISVNTTGSGQRIGTVGKVIPGDEVRIAADGEILVRGPNVMMGYYKQPEKTKEAIDADGFFHTGDIGELDADGFLKITDRKKEVFKTSGGKYIAPGKIENKLRESPFVEQVMVIGEGERFPGALIVPAFTHLKSWCVIKNITYTTPVEMIRLPEIIAKYQREVEQYMTEFGQWERVKKFALLAQEWSIDGGELTPKLSMKRRFVLDKYQAEVRIIYQQLEKVSS